MAVDTIHCIRNVLFPVLPNLFTNKSFRQSNVKFIIMDCANKFGKTKLIKPQTDIAALRHAQSM